MRPGRDVVALDCQAEQLGEGVRGTGDRRYAQRSQRRGIVRVAYRCAVTLGTDQRDDPHPGVECSECAPFGRDRTCPGPCC